MTEEAARAAASRSAGTDLDELVERGAERATSARCRSASRTSLALDQHAVAATQTANVIGLLPGSDPELRDEVVIYTAHHDHLGIGEPDADRRHGSTTARCDNASGVRAGARRSRGPSRRCPSAPRRSILLRFVGGRGAGAARLAVLRASTRPSRRDASRPTSTSTAATSGAHAGTSTLHRARQVDPRRGRRQPLSRAAGARGRGRPVPRPRLLLPLRPVQLREDRRAGALPRRRHRLHRASRPGWGTRADRGLRGASTTTSRATRSTTGGTSTA